MADSKRLQLTVSQLDKAMMYVQCASLVGPNHILVVRQLTVSGNRGRNFTSSLPFLGQWCGAAHVRLLSQITDLHCPHSALFDANFHDAHSAIICNPPLFRG
jgi:hypothetical protein